MALHLDLPRESLEEDEALLTPTEPDFLPPHKSTKKPWVLLVVLIFIIVAVVDVGAYLAEPPLTRLFEENLCLKYYREQDPSVIDGDGSIPEQLCMDTITRKDTFLSDRSMLATSASDLQSFSSASPCFAKSVCMKLVDVAHS